MSRILVVDDDIMIANLMRTMLEHKGFTVTLAGDGEEALELLPQLMPALVLSDVMMPRLDGISFCQKLKANASTAHIPVVLVTAASISTPPPGVATVIRKPFQLKHLLSVVEQYTRLGSTPVHGETPAIVFDWVPAITLRPQLAVGL